MDKRQQKLLLFGGIGAGLLWLLSKSGGGGTVSGLPAGVTAVAGANGNPVTHGGWIEVFDASRGYYWMCAPGWTCVGANPS
jgi:hypothetical protein